MVSSKRFRFLEMELFVWLLLLILFPPGELLLKLCTVVVVDVGGEGVDFLIWRTSCFILLLLWNSCTWLAVGGNSLVVGDDTDEGDVMLSVLS